MISDNTVMQVLSHQLEGIMFHADAYAVSCLNGYNNLKRLHYSQVLKETETHMMTIKKMIESTDVIIPPGQINRIHVPEDATRTDIMKLWHDWETETKRMYLHLIEEEPDCKLWMKLYKGTLHEIACIEYMI